MRFFTKREDDFLRENYTKIPCKRMAKMLGRTEGTARQRLKLLGITIPPECIQKFRNESYFKKGQSPINKGKTWNEFMSKKGRKNSRKTCFKKGQLALNKKPLGSMRITKNGYLEVKILEPNKWQAYHRLMWEETFGPIPKGGVVRFVTSDKMNVQPFNLELIDRKKNMKANTLHRYPKEISRSIQLRGALNRQINKHLKRLKNP
jgi:hypothetical protein